MEVFTLGIMVVLGKCKSSLIQGQSPAPLNNIQKLQQQCRVSTRIAKCRTPLKVEVI